MEDIEVVPATGPYRKMVHGDIVTTFAHQHDATGRKLLIVHPDFPTGTISVKEKWKMKYRAYRIEAKGGTPPEPIQGETGVIEGIRFMVTT